MTSKYVMAFDQGTTSSRAVIFDRNSTIVSLARKELTQIYPKPGWVEHDPGEIWSSQLEVAKDAIQQAGLTPHDIGAIGITNQRETTIIWDKKTGRPIHNAIVWQCRRTAPICEELIKDGWSDVIRKKTGLIVDAYFSGTKIKWILDHYGLRERAEKGEILFGTVDSWLIWNLTQGKIHMIDYSNASRTMIFNIHKIDWDDEILDKLEIPRAMLPEPRQSSEIYGMTAENIFGEEIPIAGVAGDQQAALFGQACFKPGEVKNTYGTGCFLLMNLGEKEVCSQNGLLTTIAWGINDKVEYALEGSIFIAGAAIQWLRDELQILDNAAESEKYALSVPDSGGVYIVPAFVGLGAPYWDMYARGTIVGITRGTTRAHLIRATLESIAFQTRDVLEAMISDSGIKFKSIQVDGGAAQNNFLMQFQADILGAPVSRRANTEATALGAAYLAGLAVGIWSSQAEIEKIQKIDIIYSPQMDAQIREALYEGWRCAVSRALGWVKK